MKANSSDRNFLFAQALKNVAGIVYNLMDEFLQVVQQSENSDCVILDFERFRRVKDMYRDCMERFEFE